MAAGAGGNGAANPLSQFFSSFHKLINSDMSPLVQAWPFSSLTHTASIGYAIVGALFISMQLSTATVHALQKVWVLIRL